MVHVYTGTAKGKQQLPWAWPCGLGHGGKVFMLQFMKGSKNYGEIKAAEKYLPDLTIVQSGQESLK